MKKSNFEEVSFFSDTGTNSSFKGACYIDISDTSLLGKQTMVFSEEDKVFIKVLNQERTMG